MSVVTATACLSLEPSWATDIGEYLDGKKPVTDGKTIVLTTCANIGPPKLEVPMKLFAKEGGNWTPVATAKMAKSKKCPTKKFSFQHKYTWNVDVLGRKASPLRYELELAFGPSPSISEKFVVPQYANTKALGEHYACLIIHGFEPIAVDENC